MDRTHSPVHQTDDSQDVAIIARQAHWILVSKPSGMAVHGTGDSLNDANLVDWARACLGLHVAPVGRLDKGVSGLNLLVIPSEQGGRREMPVPELDKTYLAVVRGLTRKKGVIRRPLKDQRRRRSLDAVTRYRTLAHGRAESLVMVSIETGRKHQIRRHLSGIGHPIYGDRRYGGRRPRWSQSERIWLHCISAQSDSGVEYRAPFPADWIEGCRDVGWALDGLISTPVAMEPEF